MSLWIHLGWDSVLPGQDISFLPEFREMFRYYFFKEVLTPLSLSSASGTPLMWMSVYLMFSHRSLKLSLFLNIILFFLFCLGDFHYSVFQISDLVLYITWSTDDSFQCIFISVFISFSSVQFFLNILHLIECLTMLMHSSLNFSEHLYNSYLGLFARSIFLSLLFLDFFWNFVLFLDFKHIPLSHQLS